MDALVDVITCLSGLMFVVVAGGGTAIVAWATFDRFRRGPIWENAAHEAAIADRDKEITSLNRKLDACEKDLRDVHKMSERTRKSYDAKTQKLTDQIITKDVLIAEHKTVIAKHLRNIKLLTAANEVLTDAIKNMEAKLNEPRNTSLLKRMRCSFTSRMSNSSQSSTEESQSLDGDKQGCGKC